MDNDKRTFLQTVGAGTLAGLAGCSNGGEGDNTPTEDGTTDQGPTTTTSNGSGGEAPTIITVKGAGNDIWNTADAGYWLHRTLTGDFDVRVQCTSIENTNPHAKAGIMARASTNASAQNVMLRRRAGFGTSLQWRPEEGASSTSTTSEQGAQMSRVSGGIYQKGNWQRLERSGDTIRAYGSENGEDWTLIAELPGSVLTLPDEVHIGLAVTSHDSAALCTAKFRNLSGLDVENLEGTDLGAPIIPGEHSVAQPAIGEITEPETSPNSATLTGNLTYTGGADSVDVYFEYREVMADEWQTSSTKTLDSTGEFSIEVSGLTPRRYYQYRLYTDDGNVTVGTVNQLFSTPSGSSGSSDEGPSSASNIDPNDGFADMAPWLDDDTPLVVVSEATREEFSRATGIAAPRVIVFETSGTIDLQASNLNVRNDKCWIAGQTAPSPGITLIRGGLWIHGNECVIQHLRVRPGTAGQDTGWQPDAIEMADDSQGNIIDHCTGTWSIDENINVGYDTNNSTISNCLIAEPLNEATHQKGAHGYNSIIGNNAKNVTHAGNILALATDRNPRLKQGTETVVVNNYVHHYHDGAWADPETSHAIVGCVWEDPQTDQANITGNGEVYAEDNVQLDDASVPMVGNSITQLDSEPHWPEDLEAMPSGDVASHNLANAGARPADRTEIDARIIADVEAGAGGVIDNQSEVGGYPDLAENTQELDVPTTGLRAWLREQAVAVESN